MIHILTNLIYGSTPAEFKSDYSLQQSVTRLSNATYRSSFSALTQERAVGKDSETRVSLQRIIPFVRNTFKPFFIGSFKSAGGQVLLSGKFTMHFFAKVFISFWLGFCLLFTVFAFVQVFTKGSGPKLLPLAGLGMFAFGCLLLQFSKYLSRNDTKWLSSIISKSLTKPQG